MIHGRSISHTQSTRAPISLSHLNWRQWWRYPKARRNFYHWRTPNVGNDRSRLQLGPSTRFFMLCLLRNPQRTPDWRPDLTVCFYSWELGCWFFFGMQKVASHVTRRRRIKSRLSAAAEAAEGVAAAGICPSLASQRRMDARSGIIGKVYLRLTNVQVTGRNGEQNLSLPCSLSLRLSQK